MTRSAKLVLAVDLGGTQFRVALADERGEIRERFAAPVERPEDPAGTMRAITDAAREILSGQDRASVCGVGVAGPVGGRRDGVAGVAGGGACEGRGVAARGDPVVADDRGEGFETMNEERVMRSRTMVAAAVMVVVVVSGCDDPRAAGAGLGADVGGRVGEVAGRVGRLVPEPEPDPGAPAGCRSAIDRRPGCQTAGDVVSRRMARGDR